MKRLTLISLTLIAVLLMTAPLFAQNNTAKMPCDGTGPGMNMAGKMEPGMGMMMIPDMTTDQMKKIQDLRFEHQKVMIDLKSKKELKTLDMMNMFRKDPNEKKINSAIEELEKINTQIMKERVKQHFLMRSILTDKQKEVFDMMGFKMKGNHDGMKGDMMKGGMKDGQMMKKDCNGCKNK